MSRDQKVRQMHIFVLFFFSDLMDRRMYGREGFLAREEGKEFFFFFFGLTLKRDYCLEKERERDKKKKTSEEER